MRQPMFVFVFVFCFKLFMLLRRVDVRKTTTKHNERLMCEVDFKKVCTFRCDDPCGPAINFWLIVAYVSSVNVKVPIAWVPTTCSVARNHISTKSTS